jgi:toxin ParE1/3/4
VAYRLTRAADDQIDALLLESARVHGIKAAGRYGALILAAMTAVGDDPELLGSVEVPRVRGVRAYPARLVRMRAEPERRVKAPRHLVVYHRAADGVVEVLGLVHDRMVLSRAARKLARDAEEC